MKGFTDDELEDWLKKIDSVNNKVTDLRSGNNPNRSKTS